MDLFAKLDITKLISVPNIAEQLDEKDLVTISEQVLHDYDVDCQSRVEWENRNADALKLALQVVEAKNDPWPGCANVKFPLVTIAAMQCHAREYPALIAGTEVVKCRVIGDDIDGQKTARAKRVAAHMSFQVLEEDSNWEDQMDRVMFTKPIVGTAFKKVYFDPTTGHNTSEMVLAQDLVIPYKAKSIEKANRLTHRIYFSKNAIYERVARGLFSDVLGESQPQQQTDISPLQRVSDEVQGRHDVADESDADRLVLEQHRYLDLDGDGYAEPYIVTVDEQTRKILRIVARFFKDGIEKRSGKILSIKPTIHFVKYGMIPSPDGGIYDLGFGSLLGPLNHTVNTIINQLLDAGTLNNLGGGFLGRGVKLRRGQNVFGQGEWKQTDSQDLRGQVYPLPTKEPSQVLFALLGMLVNYGERIVGTTDIMSGQNVGQNTPASTAQELVKQGSVIFNSIFKRTYRSLRDEFRMLYRLNQLFLEEQTSFEDLSTGKNVMILAEDYRGKETDIRPAADPNVASVEKKMQQAMFLKQASAQGPGYIPIAVERRMLEAAGIPYLSEVWNEKTPTPKNPKIELEQAKLQLEQAKMQLDAKLAMMELLQKADKLRAEVMELTARATKEMAQVKSEEVNQKLGVINTQITAKQAQQDGIIQSVKVIQELMASMQQQGGNNGGVQVPSETPTGSPQEGGVPLSVEPTTND
jgi:chaperonin GroES